MSLLGPAKKKKPCPVLVGESNSQNEFESSLVAVVLSEEDMADMT